MPKYIIGARGHDFGRATAKELFEKITNAGYSCVQLAYPKAITGVKTFSDVTDSVIEETKIAMSETGMKIPVLGVYVELSHMDEKLRQDHVNAFISQMPVCKKLGAGCMGTETTGMGAQPTGTTISEARRQLYKSLEKILPAAEENGVIVGIEPVVDHALSTPEFTKEVLDTMKSPNLKIIFDPGNLLSRDFLNKQEQLFGKAMELWGDKIVAVHFKGVRYLDNSAREDICFAESEMDNDIVFKLLSTLPQKELPILREHAVPENSAQEIAYIKSLFNK